MNNNIENELPKFLDKAKKIQQGKIIGHPEAESLLLQANRFKTFFLNKQEKTEKQFYCKLRIIDAKMQLVDSAKRLFESCIKRH